MFLDITNTFRKDFYKYIFSSILLILAYIIVLIFFGAFLFHWYDGVNISDFEELKKIPKNVVLFFLLFPAVITFFIFKLLVKIIHKQRIKDLTTSRKKIDYNRIFFAIRINSVLFGIVLSIQYLLSPESFEINFEFVPFFIMLFLAVVLIPFQAGFEEYLLRGYLMQGFAKLFRNPLATLLVTSVFFGVLHMFNPEVEKLGNWAVVSYIMVGLFLGIITMMDDGIELALGIHISTNFLLCVFLTSDWSVLQTYSIFKDISAPSLIKILLLDFLLFALMIYIFAKKYKWKNWRQRLITFK